MIEILDKTKRKYEVSCPDCGCEFSYSIDDTVPFTSVMHEGYRVVAKEDKEYVVCPRCGCHIVHGPMTPFDIRKMINDLKTAYKF